MNVVFDINRFVNLEKRNLSISKKSLFFPPILFIGLYLFFALLYAFTGMFNFTIFMFPISYMVVALSPCFFDNKNSRGDSLFEFTLPVSTLERYLVMLINYIVLVPILAIGSVYLMSLAIPALFEALPVQQLNAVAHSMPPLDMDLSQVATLLGMQASFLIGMLYFKRYAFVKTALILIALGILFAIVSGIMGFMLARGVVINEGGLAPNGITQMEEVANAPLVLALKYTVAVLTTVGLWVVGYLKLRETEC